MYGNFSLFDDIKEGDLSDMNWGDLALDWENADYITNSSNTTDICTPVAYWHDRESYPVVKDVAAVSKTLDR